MNVDKAISKADSFTAVFITVYLFFLAAVLFVCACLPPHVLTTPNLIADGFSHWIVRVGLLAGSGLMVFAGVQGRNFGAPRSHRKVLEEIRDSLAALTASKEPIAPVVNQTKENVDTDAAGKSDSVGECR